MNILSYLNILSEVKQHLLDPALSRQFEQKIFVAFEYEVNAVKILDILQILRNKSKMYWQNRDASFETVGAENVFYEQKLNSSEIAELEAAGIKFYLSCKFDLKSNITRKWKKFGRNFVFLPLWALERRKDKYYLILNLTKEILDDYINRDIEKCTALNMLNINNVKCDYLIKNRYFSPNRETWGHNLNLANEMIQSDTVKKIVLSRAVKYEFENKIASESIFLKLTENCENSFSFYFQADIGSVFMGISPELLFSSYENTIRCDVLAGTIARGADTELDKILADKLLHDKKEIREHTFVAKFLSAKMKKFGSKVQFKQNLKIKKLANVQHIYSEIECVKQPDLSNYKIIRFLYPTPAVCGVPAARCKRLIKEFEQYDRGHYAGAIGMICGENAEICVGIRSALTHNSNLYIYAGAGIVAGSDPEKEWNEISSKLQNFTTFLND